MSMIIDEIYAMRDTQCIYVSVLERGFHVGFVERGLFQRQCGYRCDDDMH